MADSYLSISQIATDVFMQQRLTACATQQSHLGNVNLGTDPSMWVMNERYVWASSPGWGEKWSYGLETHPDDPDYEPGRDEGVITDADILATVQVLGDTTPRAA
jgi:hypothetical protein